MGNWEVVGISLAAVFGGLGLLSLIISLFPLIFRAPGAKPAPAAAGAPAVPAAEQEDEDLLTIVAMAAIQAYEDETAVNPLVRNAEDMAV